MRWTICVAAGALSALALTACTSSTGSAGANRVNAVAGSAIGGGSVGTASAGGTASRPAATQAGATRLAPKLILTGSLSVVVPAVDRSAARAESIAAGAGGRTDADDQSSPRGARASAQLTLRVPNSAVPSVLDRLAALGRETDRHLSTRDVTTQVADVASRVLSARSSITALRALYARATKVSDVIQIESSLSQREASLESLEARQRSLGRQVALATLTVQLTQRKAATPPPVKPAQHTGFTGGLDRGWHAFTATVGALALALGVVLPFLLVLAVLAALGLVVRRRLRPHATAAANTE